MKHYDLVLYHETRLQKQIVEYLVENVFNDMKCLIISRDKNWIQIENARFYFNFHFWVSGLFSLLYLPYIRLRLKKIVCDEFCASFLPAINARILAGWIKHKRRSNIEDGLGTFLHIKNMDEVIEKIPFPLANKFIGQYLSEKKSFFDNIDRYYTIYGKSKYFNVGVEDKVYEIPVLEKGYPKLTQDIYFVGQPLVERKLLSKVEYVKNINHLAEEFKELKYFLHPSENIHYNFNDNVKVYKTVETLEDYIKKGSKPKLVLSYGSTVLVSLKLQYPEIKCHYIDSEYADVKLRSVLEMFDVTEFIKEGQKEWYG